MGFRICSTGCRLGLTPEASVWHRVEGEGSWLVAVPDRMRAWRLCASLIALAGLVAVVATSSPASAATTTFTATADALVREADPSTAFGTTTALRVDGGTDPDVQTYLRFSVAGLSGNVQSATLRLWATSPTNNGPSVFTTSSTWGESTITWANRPGLTGSGVGKVTAIATSTWAEFDVSSLVTGDGTYDLVLAGTSTDGVDFQSREAANDPQLVITTQAGSDTSAPTAPSGLTATANGSTRIDLAWTASTDDVGVVGYEIFRGGSLLTTVGPVTSYADTTVSSGTSYTYKVRAFDGAGNRSAFSNTATATAGSQTVTLTPVADARVEEANPSSNFGTATSLRVDGGNGVHVESYLMFTASGLSGSVRNATLRIYATSATVDGPTVSPAGNTWTETGITWGNKPAATGAPAADAAGISSATWVTFTVTPLVSGNGTYTFQLAGASTDGVDFASREAANDPELVLTMGSPDTQAPTAPTGLVASAGSPTQVDLTWTASTDDVAVTNYLIYRGGSLIATLGATSTTYSDTTVSANSTYSYTVKARDGAGNTSAASNTANVTTPAAGSAPVIAAGGDIACATSDANYKGGLGTSTACRQLYTSNLLVNAGYAAVLPLGDEQYNSGALSEFQAVYDPTWGRVKSISHPVVGNHEYGQSGASGYFTYFGSAAGEAGKGYYSFDVGAWHLIALNSNCSKVACGAGSAQETWLRSDLSAHPAACTLAFDHHARWSSGHDGDNTFMQAIWQDLYDAHVELLLSGHSHDYERYAPQNASGGLDNALGVRQFVVGTGGAFFTGLGTPDANSQVRNNDTYGILKLTLRSSGYDWQFVPEAGKTFTDSGSTACH